VNEMRDVAVICRRRSTREILYRHIAKYAAGPQIARPTHQSLTDDAKTELTNRRLAFPPYDDVSLEVEWL
jgi:hypothetical protein